jgi:Spy/CpxP family protein refolding chaperone
MRRGWLLVLLLSLGVNVGLGIATLQRNRQASALTPAVAVGADQPGISTAPDDTAAAAAQADRRLRQLVDRLHLDAQQGRKFSRIHHEAISRIRERQQEVRQARWQLHRLYLAGGASPDSVRQSVALLTAAQGRLDSLVAETLLQEMALLAPEQRGEYLRMMPWQQRPRGLRQGGGSRRSGHRSGR